MKKILVFIFIFILLFNAFSLQRKRIKSGLYYYKINLHLADGKPVVIHMLKLDYRKRKIKITLAGKTVKQKLPLSKIVKKYKALAGINGTYFWKSSGPLGMLISDHELISIPILRRTAFGITENNKTIWGNPIFKGRVDFNIKNMSFFIDGINQFPGKNKIILYTQEFGEKTPLKKDATELILVGTKVFSKKYGGESLIPPGGYVLSAYGNSAKLLDKISIMDSYFLTVGLDFHWSFAKYAVGGGPRLLKNGKYFISYREEQFKKDVFFGRAPRTAVGVTKRGDIIFVVVDGRKPGYSVGMKLEELAEFLLNLGCVNAMNLDGGGSSTMVINGKIVNSPSDGKERNINNAILIF